MKVLNRTDAIGIQLVKIFNKLNREARRDRCKGDIVCGWDWPTLCMVKPEVAQEIRELKKEKKEAEMVGL